MNILSIKEGRSEITINSDTIAHMELHAGSNIEQDRLLICFTNTADLVFEGRSARPVQFEIDTLMAKTSNETAIVELVPDAELVK